MAQPARKFRPKRSGAKTLGSGAPKDWQRLYALPRWRAASREYRAANPLCRACQQSGRDEPVAVVDHIIPHRGNMQLFWDPNNWQPLCLTCHHIKSTQEKADFRTEGG